MEKLVKEYMSNRVDIEFESYFDFESKKNIELKTEILKWCLDNDRTVSEHPRYLEILELRPKDENLIWD